MDQRKKDGEHADIDNIISDFNNFSKEDKLQLISSFIGELKRIHGITEEEILGKDKISIPVGIFATDALSSLEAIVKYLKEECDLRLSKIAKILNRSSKTSASATGTTIVSRLVAETSCSNCPPHRTQ